MIKNMEIKSSKNYDFHYFKDSIAERDIDKISELQEDCFEEICETLKINPEIRIQYFLVDNPELVGVIYGDNEACNGFAEAPNKIYAVYNEKIIYIEASNNTLSDEQLKQAGLTEDEPIEHTVNNIACCPSHYHGQQGNIERAPLFPDNKIDVPSDDRYSHQTENAQQYLGHERHTVCHTLVLDKIDIKPVCKTYGLAKTH